ncbi:MAG: hypothetical protein QW255_04840 [Candidatus Bilamarchaeaceae archaeon]
MLLIYKTSKVIIIKSNRENNFNNRFEYRVISLSFGKKTYFANKFMTKTNLFLTYTNVSKNITSKSKYQKVVKTKDEEQVRARIDDNNFIFLGNHGYNKKYDLFLCFDYYVPYNFRSSTKRMIFYFQFIAVGKNSELVFVIDDSSNHEKFSLTLEPKSYFKEFLLHNINNKNDNFTNTKNYFNNYKKMLQDFIIKYKPDSNKVIYPYKPKLEKLENSYTSYKEIICKGAEKDKKVNLSYHMHYDNEFTILDTITPSYYSVITKQRLLTSFITAHGLEYKVVLRNGNEFVTPPNSFYNAYILYERAKNEVILFDNADYFRKLFKSYYNEELTEQELVYNELIKDLVIDNTKESRLISLYKDTGLKVWKKSEFEDKVESLRFLLFTINNKKSSIVEGPYQSYFLYFRDLDISFYENEKSIYMKFDTLYVYLNIYGYNLNGKTIELHKELVQIYLANKYYIIKIDNNFMPFLLGNNALEKFVSIYQDLIIVNAEKRLIFAGPFILKINIDELEIKAKDLPNLCHSIVEVNIEGKSFYVFNLRIASDFAYITSTILINELKVKYTEHKNNQTKTIWLQFHKDNTKKFDYTYLGQVLSLINKGYIRILVSFYVSKNAWDSLKCDNGLLSEIMGKFYINYYKPSSASFLDIVCAPIYLQDGYYEVLVR